MESIHKNNAKASFKSCIAELFSYSIEAGHMTSGETRGVLLGVFQYGSMAVPCTNLEVDEPKNPKPKCMTVLQHARSQGGWH